MADREPPPFDDDDPKGTADDFGRMQEFFVPVHGYVRFYPEEVAIINHPTFQRLRRCLQLGFAHLVFPGATHTRFEHCLGAVHVAEKMMQYVDGNYHSKRRREGDRRYELCGLSPAAKAFIRLGALLHDIGHIPLGHTLEDELCHLAKHDGAARLQTICARQYPEHGIDGALELGVKNVEGGWSLQSLINRLFDRHVSALFADQELPLSAFDIIKLITLKSPDPDSQEGAAWRKSEDILNRVFPVDVARDIIGNTICADFLDYIQRDWYHIGKPMTEDRRLYQYMEIRRDCRRADTPGPQQFVINMGPQRKFRHDALTAVFELLEARYKLAETVIFHRTKLAITALLDRCFLELRHLYDEADLKSASTTPSDYLAERALDLLLRASDDDLPNVIRELAEGSTSEDKARLQELRRNIQDDLPPTVSRNRDTPLLIGQVTDLPIVFDVRRQQALILKLATRLEQRAIYTLATRVLRSDLHWKDLDGENIFKLPESVVELVDPNTRLLQIRMIEEWLSLPEGSVALYAPPGAQMNAKLAAVKMLIDGEITSLWDYDKKRGENSLMGGLLVAQIRRFCQLWGVSIYVERSAWHDVDEERREGVEDFLRCTVYQPRDVNLADRRRGLEPVIRQALKAARSAYGAQTGHSEFSGRTFVSGLSYDAPTGGA